jgi:hypothetical protein
MREQEQKNNQKWRTKVIADIDTPLKEPLSSNEVSPRLSQFSSRKASAGFKKRQIHYEKEQQQRVMLHQGGTKEINKIG